ncbi:MAG: TIR domain-containing protein [Planctomycetota bacterium]
MTEFTAYRGKARIVASAIRLRANGDEGLDLHIDGRSCVTPTWLLELNGQIFAFDESVFELLFECATDGALVPTPRLEARRVFAAGTLPSGRAFETDDYLVRSETRQLEIFPVPSRIFESFFEREDGSAESSSPKRYRAFISYSRADLRVAKRLHRSLERYRLPRHLARAGQRKLGRFFRDDDELSGTAKLGAALDGAIDDSEQLIVISSPAAARSHWVNKEVIRFKRRTQARILAVIARGKPNAAEPKEECFPPALRHRVDLRGQVTDLPADPPLAPNLSEEGFSKALIRIISGLVDSPFDDLWRREKRRRRSRVAISAGIALIGASLTLFFMALQTNRSDAVSLRSRASRISTEQWRFGSEARAFDSAFRAALGASKLSSSPAGLYWDLRNLDESTSCALALSGRVASSRRIFGEYPDTSNRTNFRDDIPDADPYQRVAVRGDPIARDLSFSADGNRLVASTDGSLAVVFDLPTGRSIRLERTEINSSSRVALDVSGSSALVVTSQRLFHLVDYDSENWRELPLPEGLSGIHDIEFLNGQWWMAGKMQGDTVVGPVDLAQSKLIRPQRLPEFTPYQCNSFCSLPPSFVGFESRRGLSVADFTRGEDRHSSFEGLAEKVGQVKAIAADDAGRLVAIGGNGSGSRFGSPIQVIDFEAGKELALLEGHTGEVYSIDFLPATRTVVSAGSDFTVRFWDADSGRELFRLAGHLAEVWVIQASPDGRYLATSGGDGMVLLWDLSFLESFRAGKTSSLPIRPSGSGWEAPVTRVTREERQQTPALQGRPWDIRDWREPASVSGAVQSARAALVRWFGLESLDYSKPAVEQ